VGFVLSAAYSLVPGIHLVVGDRFRDVEIGRGAVISLPSIGQRFTAAEVPGIEGFTTHAQQVGLKYSSLDDADMPTQESVAGADGRGCEDWFCRFHCRAARRAAIRGRCNPATATPPSAHDTCSLP
jgi:hypothetical protein